MGSNYNSNQYGSLYDDCWRFISSFRGVSTLEDVFAKWASNRNLDVLTANIIWGRLNSTINDLYYNRMADTIINIEDYDEKTPPKITVRQLQNELSKRDENVTPVINPPFGSPVTKELVIPTDVESLPATEQPIPPDLLQSAGAGLPPTNEAAGGAGGEMPQGNKTIVDLLAD